MNLCIVERVNTKESGVGKLEIKLVLIFLKALLFLFGTPTHTLRIEYLHFIKYAFIQPPAFITKTVVRHKRLLIVVVTLSK